MSDLSLIKAGENLPNDVNVVIEVPMNSDPVKYEFDKDSGFIFVDRYVATPMFYPCNYGFVPHTLSGDGDPIDVLVVGQYPLLPGSVIRVKPVGVLVMEDEKGEDAKVIAVPHPKLTKLYENVNEYTDLPELLIAQIRHFFENYKSLEKGKFVKVTGYKGRAEAEKMIQTDFERAKAQNTVKKMAS
jgi:inorganic pyrophosphatase